MPLTIPPFTQFQAPTFPLRGLWNHKPAEGDRFIACEVDWGAYPAGQAVQFALSGNSPVALSQIVALSVDNARCGADVQFIFSDSGFILQIPAHAAGVYPVFSNGMNFYLAATGAGASDVTCFNVHNSMPPPIPMQLTARQNAASVTGISLANGTTQIVALGINGTLNALSIVVAVQAAASAETGNVSVSDGTGKVVWAAGIDAAINAGVTLTFNPTGLAVRFINGLVLTVTGSTLTGGYIVANAYYSVP